MKTMRALLLAGVAAAGLVSGAGAATITQTVTVGGGTDSLTTDLNNVAFNALVNRFDAAGVQAANPGLVVTLNAVQLALATALSTSGTLTNQSATAQTFSFALSLNSFVGGVGAGGAAQETVLRYFGSGTDGDVSRSFATRTFTNIAPGQTVSYPNANGTRAVLGSNPSVVLTDAASLAAFTGPGAFGLGLNTRSLQATSGGGGNVASQLDTRAGGSFTVTYDYSLTRAPVTSVPEPASLALFGVGLIGLAMIRRKA